MIFTVEESNLISIYAADTKAVTAANIRAALPYIDEPDMLGLAQATLCRLETVSEAEFAATAFEPVYPVIFSEEDYGK